MKADISLAERRLLEREHQAEIRTMLAPRHFATVQEQAAVDAALQRLELEQLRQATPAIYAALGRSQCVAQPAPVVMPELVEPEALPVPLAVRPRAQDGLRQRFGLR